VPALRLAIAPALPAAALLALAALAGAQDRPASPDPLRDLQDEFIATKADPSRRAYHFGSQGAGREFSNHTSHTNRMVPVYVWGTKADLGAVMGANSRYRTEDGVRSLYGRVPEHTVNPRAEYADQSDLYRVQKEAAAKGAKYIFTVWFDGMDWETTQAAAIAKSGKVYTSGKGAGLFFLDFDAKGSAQYGSVVTSPTHNDPPDELVDVNNQTIGDLSKLLRGGYDPRFAGEAAGAPGPLLSQGPGYLKGQSASAEDKAGVAAAGGVLHAYTDSSCSAGEYATGVKSFNNGVNVAPDGRFTETIYQQLQKQGWKVGTVTSVPFSHASPAGMYAHDVSRDDYQDLSREMLGLPAITQRTGKVPALPGLDVVMGAGWGIKATPSNLKVQGQNAVEGNTYLADADLKAIDVAGGGKYVVAQRTPGTPGAEGLLAAARRAAEGRHRLFGFYGVAAGHLPYRTADGRYDPAKGIKGVAERYSAADLKENPTLADMTRAALTVLAAEPGKPFALFVEAGDVDFALHDNNLDNAVGAVISGDEAIRVIVEWVEKHSNWDESVVIVTADHGHYLVIDDPKALAGTAK
jgi:alkaline phosphatase